MSMGMKVSKPGFNVLFATNDQLAFNSELATHSIYNRLILNKSSGTTNLTYSHNLGYVPKIWVFKEWTDGSGFVALRRIPTIESNRVDYKVSTTDLFIQTQDTGAYTFHAIIFTRSIIP